MRFLMHEHHAPRFTGLALLRETAEGIQVLRAVEIEASPSAPQVCAERAQMHRRLHAFNAYAQAAHGPRISVLA